MKILQNYPLRQLNTFGLDAYAERFVEIFSEKDLQEIVKNEPAPYLILGGGSNMVFTRDVPGLVIKNSIGGIGIVKKFGRKVWVRVGGGVVWHDFVLWAVENNFGGVENLSLIPGTVGAAPVQNIGAYGVELKQSLLKLHAIDLRSGNKRVFSNTDCQFGYRDSIFKRAAKNQFCITTVFFSLTQHSHRIETNYGDVQRTLAAMGVSTPAIADVSRAVIQIRQSKLPDPHVLGNCGSFFKNPELDVDAFNHLLKNHEKVPHFPQNNGRIKVPAGWLIEQCGWKGKRRGKVGCYEKQALVLVNFGGATGEEVRQFAEDIARSVELKFDIRLEPEVNIL